MASEPARTPEALHHASRVWIVGTAAALGLVIAGLIITSVAFQRRMIRDIENDQVAVTTQQRLIEWAIDVHKDGLAEEVVRLARSADVKEAIALGGRNELLDQLEPPLNRLRKGPFAISRLSLYAPDGRLLLHAHEPADVGTPSLDDRRLLATAIRDRRIVKGLELIGGVPHLLAVSPIYQDGKFVALLESGTSLAPVTRALRSVTGAHVGLRLVDGRVVDASKPELFAEVLRSVTPIAEPSRHVVQNDQQALAVTLLPLTSFSGQMVGHLALVFDAPRMIATLEASNAVTLVIAVIGCVAAGGLLLLLSRRLDGFHIRLEQLHATADEHRKRAERRAEGLAAVSAMTRSIASAETPAQAATAVANAAATVLGAALTRIWMEGPAPGSLRPVFAWGAAADVGSLGEVTSISAGSGVVGKVFESQAPEYRVDIQEDGRWLNPRFAQDAGLHAYAGLPLVARGRALGVMSLLFTERRDFTSEEKELMTLLADSVAIALERSRAAEGSFLIS